MKKILLIAFFYLPLLAAAQTTKPISGFLGVPFGSSRQAVLTAIKAKGGIVDAKRSNAGQVAFSNVKLGTRKVALLMVKFVNNKVLEADFFLFPEDKSQLMEFYNGITSDLNDAYGKGELFKTFQEPYSDGDGQELAAIEAGKAEYMTAWRENLNDDSNSITAKIKGIAAVTLIYQDGKLVLEAIAKEKKKNAGDM